MGVGKPKERTRSRAFTELCLMFAGSMSVRDAQDALNRVLWRTEETGIKLRTYSDCCQRQGRRISELSPLLWTGDVSAAVAYLKGLNPEFLRSKNRIEELQNYLKERREQIPCCALRSALGLRISSKRVEKANDMIVARRQKNNGMSWSETGSGALAQISALSHNGALSLWLEENRLSIFPAHSA